MPQSADNSIKAVTFEALTDLLTAIFVKAGVNEHNARILASNCAGCERDGYHSHGIFRIAGFLGSLNSGWVDGNAVPVIEQVGASFLRIDANNGFAQPALAMAESCIDQMLKATGIAVVAIRDSHHFSALWPDIEPFASAGCIALTLVSSGRAVFPPGGREQVLGTNPIAFASPVDGSHPLIFDFATSAMAKGDVMMAARAGESVPLGTGVNQDGQLTTDAAEILKGGLLPFGGHKGAALSVMIEILASGLTGGQFSFEVDCSAHEGAETPKTGQLLIVIDPARGGNDRFAGRVRTLLDGVRAAGQSRLPGDRLYQQREKSERDGIAIRSDRYADLLRCL